MTALTKSNETQMTSVEYFSDSTIAEFIASRHCSENTSKTYRNSIRQLLKFFVAKKVTEPRTADVDNFINGLRAAKKSDSTIRLYATTTKLFFAFLAKRGIYSDVAADCEPLRLRKSITHKKQALTNAQARALLNSVKGDSLVARRDRAIVALALQTGVRCCEISRLNVGNLRDDGCGGYFAAVIGKGHVTPDDIIRVAPAVRELIDSYLACRGDATADAPLFISTSRNTGWQKNRYGSRLSEQSVGKMIKRMMIAVGIRSKDKKKDNPCITPHSTRHYTITQALRNKIDIRDVSQMARHSSLSITMIYAHDISLETRRAELSVADSLFGAA